MPYHLGCLNHTFQYGEINGDEFENADETQFVFSIDNNKNLGYINKNDVKYADIVSSDDPITVVMRLTRKIMQ